MDKASSGNDKSEGKEVINERELNDNHGNFDRKSVTWKVNLEHSVIPPSDSSSECSGTESNLAEDASLGVSLELPVSLSLGEIPEDSSEIPSVTNFEINHDTEVLLEFDTMDEKAIKFRDLLKGAGLNKMDLEFEYTQRIPTPAQTTIDRTTYTGDTTSTTNVVRGPGTYVIRTHNDDDDDTDIESDWDYDDLPQTNVITLVSVACQTDHLSDEDLNSNIESAEELSVSGVEKEDKIEIRIRTSDVFRNIFNKFVPKKLKLKNKVQVVPLSSELEEMRVDPEDSSLSGSEVSEAIGEVKIKTKLFKLCLQSCFPYLFSSRENEEDED